MRKELNALEKAVLYICNGFSDQPFELGSLKMNKIIWFSDVTALSVKQKTLTGCETYLAQDFGPVLPSIINAVDLLSYRGLISTREFNLFDNTQRIFELQDKDMFNKIEKTMDAHDKAILNEWMEYARSVSAVEIANTSHQYSWWDDIELGTPITAEMGLNDPCVPGIQEDIIKNIMSEMSKY